MNTPKYKGLGFCDVTWYFARFLEDHEPIPTSDEGFLKFMEGFEGDNPDQFNVMLKYYEEARNDS